MDYEKMLEQEAYERVLALARKMPGIVGLRSGPPRTHGEVRLVNLNSFSGLVIGCAGSWREMLFSMHFAGIGGGK